MPRYSVSMRAELHFNVEADNEDDAVQEAYERTVDGGYADWYCTEIIDLDEE